MARSVMLRLKVNEPGEFRIRLDTNDDGSVTVYVNEEEHCHVKPNHHWRDGMDAPIVRA